MMLSQRIPELQSELKDVASAVENAHGIMLVSGNNPDGDSIGTLVALGQYCTEKGKQPVGFCIADIPENLDFLEIPLMLTRPDQIPQSVDTVITFDLGQLSQTGLADWIEQKNPTVINIDHHKTNDLFGNVNMVHTEAAATTELVYNLFLADNVSPSKASATALLTGLVNDTGNLSNPATSPSALDMAANLVRRGAKLNAILERMYKNKTLPALNLWGDVIGSLHTNAEYGVTIAVISEDHFSDYNADDEWVEGLANFLTVLGDGTKAIIVLREYERGTIKGSMRTTRDDVDLETLARCLGGGGHKKASGFTLEGVLAKKNAAWYIT